MTKQEQKEYLKKFVTSQNPSQVKYYAVVGGDNKRE